MENVCLKDAAATQDDVPGRELKNIGETLRELRRNFMGTKVVEISIRCRAQMIAKVREHKSVWMQRNVMGCSCSSTESSPTSSSRS